MDVSEQIEADLFIGQKNYWFTFLCKKRINFLYTDESVQSFLPTEDSFNFALFNTVSLLNISKEYYVLTAREDGGGRHD